MAAEEGVRRDREANKREILYGEQTGEKVGKGIEEQQGERLKFHKGEDGERWRGQERTGKEVMLREESWRKGKMNSSSNIGSQGKDGFHQGI